MLLTCNVFAMKVSGTPALGLRSALLKAGAEPRQLIEVSTVAVQKLSCTQESGFVLGPLGCTFDDLNSTQEKNANAQASLELKNALERIGVTSTNFRQGEYAKFIIGAKSIICSSGFSRGYTAVDCEIK